MTGTSRWSGVYEVLRNIHCERVRARRRRDMREIAALDSALLANNRSSFRRVAFTLQLNATTHIVNHLRPCLPSRDGADRLRLTSLY